MRYQVFIPASDMSGFNVTLTVDATNWFTALRAGLHELGEQGTHEQPVGLLLDIASNGVHVTDPQSRRVFRIRELEVGGPAPPRTDAPAGSPPPFYAEHDPESVVTAALKPAQPAPAAGTAPPRRAPAPGAPAPRRAPAPRAPARRRAPAPAPARAAGAPRRSKRKEVPVVGRPAPTPARDARQPDEPVVAPTARRVRATPPPQKRRRRPSSVIDVKRERAVHDRDTSPPVREAREINVEEVLAEVFEEIQELFFLEELEGGVNFVIDLAMRKVPSEAGSILFADINARDLYFMAARGPRAQEVMEFRVPMGKGIVGFAAVEGMALAVSDVRKDPRFYKEISERINFDTRSVLCAPVHVDGRCMGAIELINRIGSNSYSSGEVNIVSYVADQFGRWLRDNVG